MCRSLRSLTLTALRTKDDFDRLDFGGCGCFVDEEEDKDHTTSKGGGTDE